MSLVLANAPATEPLLPEEVKQHLRLEADFDEDDDYITALIPAARQYVENYTNRSLITQTWRLTLDRFPSCYDVIELCRPALIAVTSVKYIDTAGVEQTMSTSDYSVDTDAYPGRIILGYQKQWPSPRLQRNAVTVLFTCGYGADASSVPAPLLAAMKLLIGHWYENRESVVVGQTANELPQAVQALLTPYRFYEAA